MLTVFKLHALAACMVVLTASPASSADLAARHGRIGAIFAEPPAHGGRVLAVEPRPQGVFYSHALKVPGYYGRPTDFEYRNYYGSSPLDIYSRLPYACGFVALC